jgi:hypothetical protein
VLGTFDFLDNFQVDFTLRQVRIAAAQPAADNAHKQSVRVEHGLESLSGRQLHAQKE